jgi:carboxypeptidase Q
VKRILLVCQLLVCSYVSDFAQEADQGVINSIFNEALTDHTAYDNLRVLCKTTAGRVTGSAKAEEAVLLTSRMMKDLGFDSVYRQPVQVPHWERGRKESAFLVSRKSGKEFLSVAALGMSVGTGPNGIKGQVIELKSLDDLAKLGKERISGRIVFFNRPMDPTVINTFAAYGGAADQRTQGASKAAEYGAAGVIVRSLTTAADDFPHTGVLRYAEGVPKIPAVAVSTRGADLLSRRLQEEPDLTVFFRTDCRTLPEVTSANVIGEIRGSLFPDQIITVGGHLDAWDLGEGAHDDGTGCMQAMEVLRIIKKLGIRPKRTIRAVMFMDEEIAQRGGAEYARQAELKGEKHWFALESDRGGLLPVGIGISASPERFKKMLELNPIFELYGNIRITEGGGGVDIGPLRKLGTPLASLVPDSQRYFDYHHSGNDTFDNVNIREMQLGSAAITALVYLVDAFDL